MSRPVLHLASKQCDECLFTKNRLVTGERAAAIIRECKQEDKQFICHRGSEAGVNLHCAGMHKLQPSRSYRLAEMIGIPIIKCDPNNLEDIKDD